MMVADLERAERLVELRPAERALLAGVERPIVIARRREGAPVADSVAPGNPDLGVMLAYTPLHHLLLADAGLDLVMTSGNASDEPIAFDDDDAIARLAAIADLFCVHDRPIRTRTDDSVLRALGPELGSAPLIMRRSRGWVPRPIAMPLAVPEPLARLRRRAEEHLLPRPWGERLALAPHRRPEELRDARLVPGRR